MMITKSQKPKHFVVLGPAPISNLDDGKWFEVFFLDDNSIEWVSEHDPLLMNERLILSDDD